MKLRPEWYDVLRAVSVECFELVRNCPHDARSVIGLFEPLDQSGRSAPSKSDTRAVILRR